VFVFDTRRARVFVYCQLGIAVRARGCAGMKALVLALPGLVCLFFCPSVTPHVFEFPYAICVEGYLRGRHLLRISWMYFENTVATMKARVEEGRDSFACNVQYDKVHRNQ
jgi:hypothetical protein